MDKTPFYDMNAEPDESPTQFWSKVEHHVTRGKPAELRLDMTVCQMHQLWDDLWTRGNRVASALNKYADKLRSQAQSLPRKEKIQMNKRAEFHSKRAQSVSHIAEYRFGHAQEDFACVLVLDEDQREAFFDEIGQRPGIEHNWRKTLQEVLEAVVPPANQSAQSDTGEISEADLRRTPVDASRLDCGLWLPQGDIHAACSLSDSHKNKIRNVKTFKDDGKLWTVMGLVYGPYHTEADGYPLIPVDEYTGTTDKVPYSYEGELCQHKGVQYRLGPKHTFVAKDRPVEQWQRLLKSKYDKGGYFTSGKTYHEVLNDFAGKDHWDPEQQEYVHGSAVAPNYFKAIELELAMPDYSKHEQAQPASIGLPLEQLVLAFT